MAITQNYLEAQNRTFMHNTMLRKQKEQLAVTKYRGTKEKIAEKHK